MSLKRILPENFGPLCDALLVSFAWTQDGRDLSLQLVLGGGTKQTFAFIWVNHLRISIEQPEKGASQPFSCNGSAERTADGRLKVQIDFASQGEISFECESISADGI